MERQAKDGTIYQKVGEDEWTPVTRAAKDGTVFKKVGADEWAPLETPKAPAPENSANDHYVGATKAVLFGTRPFVAGVGGGIGNAIGMDNSDMGLAERIKAIPGNFQSGFKTARADALAEEADLAQRRPGLSTAYDVGGAVLTAPLVAGKALQGIRAGGIMSGAGQAAKVGAGLGAAEALGHAENSGEAIETIGKGALIGAGAQVGANAVAKAAPVVGRALAKGAKKIASGLTGIDEKVISTYAQRADQVKSMIKNSGGEISEAADQVRRGITKDIQVTRQKLGNQIGKALDGYEGVLADGKPILQSLDDTISKVGEVTARFRPDEINELKNLRDLVAKSLLDDGMIQLKTLSAVKEELQAIAKPSYMNGAMIFPKGDLAAKAAKGAAGEARRILNQAAPEIRHANEQLSKLHRIEELINKNLIREGKPESALIAAGGGNDRNAKLLGAIDQITGGTAVKQAENLAAARTFGNPQLLPQDFTGKSVSRMLAGGGAGTLLGGPVGGAVGTALTSPLGLKYGIETTRFIERLAKATGKMLPRTPDGAGRAAILSQGIARSSEGPAAESSINRRLRFLEKGRNTKTGRE